MPARPGRSSVWRGLRWVLAGLTVLLLVPLLSVLATALIANTLGCAVDEGSIHPCLVAGTDIGGLLYTMGMMGWLMIFTAPLTVLALLGWLVAGLLAVARILRWR